MCGLPSSVPGDHSQQTPEGVSACNLFYDCLKPVLGIAPHITIVVFDFPIVKMRSIFNVIFLALCNSFCVKCIYTFSFHYRAHLEKLRVVDAIGNARMVQCHVLLFRYKA